MKIKPYLNCELKGTYSSHKHINIGTHETLMIIPENKSLAIVPIKVSTNGTTQQSAKRNNRLDVSQALLFVNNESCRHVIDG